MTPSPLGSMVVCPVRDTGLATEPCWTDPGVLGVVIRDHWIYAEPTQGTYDWSYFDQGCSLARQYGKWIVLSLNGGGISSGTNAWPSWITAAPYNVPVFNTTANTTHACPYPWNASLQSQLQIFINAMGARYNDKGFIRGITCYLGTTSLEMFFVQNATDATNLDTIAGGGANSGYTLLLNACETIAGYWATAFPNITCFATVGDIYNAGNPSFNNNSFFNSFIPVWQAQTPGLFRMACNELKATFPVTPSPTFPHTAYACSSLSNIMYQLLQPTAGLGQTLSSVMTNGYNCNGKSIQVYPGDPPTDETAPVTFNGQVGASNMPSTWVSNGNDVDVTQTGTINGTNIITGLSNTALLQVGWSVRGNYIQAGTTITSIDSSSQIHISLAATNSGSFSIGFVSTASYSSGTNSVQACHDNFASNGDTITVPNGTFNWHVGVYLTLQLTFSGSGPANVIIQNQQTNSDPGYGLHMISGTTGHSYLTGIYFLVVGVTGSPSFQVALDRQDTSSPGNQYTVIVKNCTFDSGTVFNYGCIVLANGILFGSCTFKSQSTTGTPLMGVTMVCDKYGFTSSWNTASTMGSLDTTGLNNIYIEDSTFINGATSGTNFDDNARCVIRHCTIQDTSIEGHGQDTSQYGQRHTEIYNNTFSYTVGTSLNENGWCGVRGGVLLVANNSMDQIPGKASIALSCQNINRGGSVGACQNAYPANRQAASGWSSSSSVTYGNPVVTQDGTGYILDPCYFWNNTGAGGNSWASFIFIDQYSPDNCGNGLCITIPFTGTVSNGSNVITGITITPQSPGFTAVPTLTLGMGIYDSTGLYFPQGTYITAISGSGSAPTSVTVSQNAGASHTGASLVSGYITQGRDFIVGTARPGWSPYTYPHPLLSGSTTPGSGLTADADAKITNTVVGVTTGAYPVPANNYVALYSTQFTAQTKAGATEFTTSGYSTYARQAMGASGAGWSIAAYASGTGVVWKNVNAVIFPAVPSGGAPQPFFSLGWCDALTAGNIDFFVDSSSSVTIPLGISVYLPASTGSVFTTY